MTYEAGKAYITRGGMQAVVLARVGDYVIGHYGGDKEPNAGTWHAETGAYSKYESETCLDLMPPEPEIETPDVGQLLAWFEGSCDEDAPRGVRNVARESIKLDRARRPSEPTKEMLEECWGEWTDGDRYGWHTATLGEKISFIRAIRKALEMQAGRI